MFGSTGYLMVVNLVIFSSAFKTAHVVNIKLFLLTDFIMI